ncbi:IS91 family transposase, partial [Microvirga yunnanensis]|uniref:IS91 family transposase n=1 Tax=Microvirga yunnanensis TaxID=2953740 RepID=UPI0021C7CF0B
ACRPNFFLPVRVLSRLFRRLFLDGLARAQAAGRLGFFGAQAHLAEPEAFNALLAGLRRMEWVVYCKRPFSGPAAVLAYLARYTHRVAISNSRLIACDAEGVSFRWKDYRVDGRARSKVMRLSVDEFIRRFLLHVLPDGFHRIRHYGLFGNGVRQANLARARTLLAAAADKPMADAPDAPIEPSRCCPCCGGRMLIIERFARGCAPYPAPSHPIRIDTS